MSRLRGQAVTLAALMVSAAFGSLAMTGLSGADENHGRIVITGDGGFAACACVRSGSGTAGDPYIISDWRIDHQSGTAIEIRDVSKHFVLRDNTLRAKTGIIVGNTGNRGAIVNNQITFTANGVDTWSSSPEIVGNQIMGPATPNFFWGATGIKVVGGSPLISANHIARAQRGIHAFGATVTIQNNQITENHDGVHLTESSDGTLTGNTVRLAGHYGLVVEKSASATLINNEVREGQGGIIVRSATLHMEGNRVINQRAEAVRFDQAVVTMFRNTITDNWRGAHGSTDSDVNIVENTFSNNQDSGVRLTRSEGTLARNTFTLNGIGVRIDDSIAVTLTDNTFANNTFGVSIPYSARQIIPLMSGNVVNGINIDGTLRPSEKSMWYKTANVVVNGRLVDSGHSAGFFGTVTQQGALVLYDVVGAEISNNRIEWNHRGILVVNSTFVTIAGNTFRNNQEGVFSEWSRTFIKDNECDIDIDPPQTFCFKAQGGFVTIRANIIATVDIGIIIMNTMGKVTGAVVENNLVTQTRIGIQAFGTLSQVSSDVLVQFNRLEFNKVGAALIGFRGTLQGNTIGNNTGIAVELSTRSNVTATENRIHFNGAGIVDIDACQPNFRTKCSSGVFTRNRVVANADVGIHVKNGGRFEDDVVLRNKAGIIAEGRVSLHGVTAESNANVGLTVVGRAALRGGVFTDNGRDGVRGTGHVFAVGVTADQNRGDGFDITGRADIVGGTANNNSRVGADIKGSAHLRHGNFSANVVAGLRLNGTVFRLFDCEVSFNGNGIIMAEAIVEVQLPGIPSIEVPDVPNPFPDEEDRDPLWMNECNLVKNKRFAVSASANTIINATVNYWGADGPTFAVPLVPTSNTINALGLFTPYWRDRAHTQAGFMPTTPFGPEPVI